jgi:hypothetical protein
MKATAFHNWADLPRGTAAGNIEAPTCISNTCNHTKYGTLCPILLAPLVGTQAFDKKLNEEAQRVFYGSNLFLVKKSGDSLWYPKPVMARQIRRLQVQIDVEVMPKSLEELFWSARLNSNADAAFLFFPTRSLRLENDQRSGRYIADISENCEHWASLQHLGHAAEPEWLELFYKQRRRPGFA